MPKHNYSPMRQAGYAMRQMVRTWPGLYALPLLALCALLASSLALSRPEPTVSRQVVVQRIASAPSAAPAASKAKAVVKVAPKPVAAPVAAPVAPKAGIETLIARYWPYDDAWALRCTSSESVRYTDFTGGQGERGPWQIFPRAVNGGTIAGTGYTWADMPTDPHNFTERQIQANTAVAVALYNSGGKAHWHAPGCR